MTKYFREEEIEEFRECFYLNARESKRRQHHERVTCLHTMEELKWTLMSLGVSPTLAEIRQYWKENDGKLTFAEFLEVLYKAKQIEQIPEDIINGFKAQDQQNKGTLPLNEIILTLQKFDALSRSEIDKLLRDGKVKPGTKYVDYENFVNEICSNQNYNSMNGFGHEPLPDYY